MRYWILIAALLAPCLCAQDDVRRAFAQLQSAHPTHIRVEDLAGLENGSFTATIRDFAVTGDLPCVLIVGSLHFREKTSAEACVHIARMLLEDKALRDHFSKCEVVILPCLAPDARMVGDNGVSLKFDDDRDGRFDEDGPSDLNGGGITQMRVKRKGGRYVLSTLDPRVMIEAAPGTIGEYDLYWEGKDEDGDGRINEDPRGTITVANDWAIRWNDKQPGANRFMMQLKETRALADFAIRKTSLLAGFQLRTAGAAPVFASGPRAEGRREGEDPLARDKAMIESFGKAWGEVPRGAVKSGPEGAGNLLDWLYETQGAFAATLPLVTLTAPREEKKEEDETAERREKPGEDELHQLAWLNYRPEDYVDWETYDHPQLGEVEIGGWKLHGRANPKDADVAGGASRVAAFLTHFIEAAPRLEADKVEVEDKGGGLYRVRLTLHNAGQLDYRTQFDVDKRIHLPLFVSLSETRDVELLSGARRQNRESIDGGGTATFEWLVRVKDAVTELKFAVESDRTGPLSHNVAVKDCGTITEEED
jgi:hypothetical protein